MTTKVSFEETNLGTVTVLVTDERRVLGTILDHCGGWNYTARYVDPDTKLTISTGFDIEEGGEIDASLEEYDKIVYDSLDTREREDDAFDQAKKFLFGKANELFGPLELVVN